MALRAPLYWRTLFKLYPYLGKRFSMSSWLQVNINTTPAQAEALADFIVGLTRRGVEILDQNDNGWEVKGFLDSEANEQYTALQGYLSQLSEPWQMNSEQIPDQDWQDNWRKYFSPFRLTSQIWIAPPWQAAPAKENELVIIIDPGQAFGTGQHQSTHLCLLYLQRLAQNGLLPGGMLDVGCGTGILALAFLKLGGANAVGIDIDSLAIEASRHNARLNHIDKFAVSNKPLEELEEAFPLIAANLTALDLINMAQAISGRLAPQGFLLCSGLLTSQVDQVVTAFAAHGLSLREQSSLEGWAALVLCKAGE